MTFAAYGRFTEAGIRRIARERAEKIEHQRRELPATEPEMVVVPFVPSGRAIIHRIADENGLTFHDIVGLSRAKHIVKARFDAINARNYNDLWFYSNPVFVSVE